MPDQFDPFAKGELYEKHERRWRLEQFVAEATLAEITSGEWLPKFSAKELEHDYKYRRDLAVPLDLCRDGAQIRLDNLWRTAPKREADGKYAKIIQQLVDDADNEGTGLDAFMRRVVWMHYVNGCDVVVQMSNSPDGTVPATKADEARMKLRPYFLAFDPLARYDWSCTGSGKFNWARYCLGVTPSEDELGDDGEIVTEFLTVSPYGWRRHTARQKSADDTPHVTSTPESGWGPMAGLSQAPIVKVYSNEKIGEWGVPLSILTRPAVLARTLLNVQSQAHADLIAAVTRYIATGATSDDVPDVYGPGMVAAIPNENATFQVIQGDVDHIREKREWVDMYAEKIRSLLRLPAGTSELVSGSGSGARYAMERTDLDNELRTTAARLERVEVEMMRQAVSLATGKEIPREQAEEELGYSVRYNRDFVLEPIEAMLANIVSWTKDAGLVSDDVPTITKEMERQLVNGLMREGTDEYEQAMDEIDGQEIDTKPATIPQQLVTGTPVPPEDGEPMADQEPPEPPRRRRDRARNNP